MSSGTVDKINGRAKETAGTLLGSDKLKHEGRTDRIAAKVEDAAGKVVESAKRIVKGH
jgi:uncharacterized protein YjbJ (UPF0337 family)